MSTASPPPPPDEWTEASITAEAVALDFWAAVRSPLVVLSSSVAGRVAAAALLLWLLAAMTTCMLPTLTQPERFARYVAYYEQRHALWSGLAAPPDLVRRLWAYVLGEHGLLRVFAPTLWVPLPQPGWLPQWSVLLALTQLTCALAAVAFLPPLTDPLPPELRDGAPLVTFAVVLACIFHLPAKLALDALFERRQLARSWRVTSDGWLERHNLARALLTHVDGQHTMRELLRLWRANATIVGQLSDAGRRLSCAWAIRVWLQSGEVVAVEDAERRLREQKQAAWAMMRNDALHSFAKQIALRVRPLEERLKGAMRLSEAAIARFASNVDRRLTLKPWEEMLKHPPVRAVMFVYVTTCGAVDTARRDV